MKKMGVVYGIIMSSLLAGGQVCHAEKWDKNNFQGKGIEAGFYDADSVKVKGAVVSWTEKYIFAPDGVGHFTGVLAKFPVCKQNIAKKGSATQFQVDYQVEHGKYRGAGKRYYNKSNELICEDKDLGSDFDTKWYDNVRNSPIEEAMYDLVTKYKVIFK